MHFLKGGQSPDWVFSKCEEASVDEGLVNNNPFAIVKLKKMAWYILPVVKKTKNYFCEHNLLPVMQKLLLTCLLICAVAQST